MTPFLANFATFSNLLICQQLYSLPRRSKPVDFSFFLNEHLLRSKTISTDSRKSGIKPSQETQHVVCCECCFCVWRHQSKYDKQLRSSGYNRQYSYGELRLSQDLTWVNLQQSNVIQYDLAAQQLPHRIQTLSPNLGGAKTMKSLLHASPPSTSANDL